MITEATWKLPEGHKSVAAHASEADARAVAQMLVPRAPKDIRYYITDKRGAWEVIQYRP